MSARPMQQLPTAADLETIGSDSDVRHEIVASATAGPGDRVRAAPFDAIELDVGRAFGVEPEPDDNPDDDSSSDDGSSDDSAGGGPGAAG